MNNKNGDLDVTTLSTTPSSPVAVALVPSRDESVAMVFERLARDPLVDVEKLERLIAMHERVMQHQAKAAFDAAFSEMQAEIPIITERGEIVVGGQVRSRYATNDDIQEAIKPILQRHGFSIRFRHEAVEGNTLKVVGILSHRSGHSEEDQFVTPADSSGSKNDIQAIGSARSYGQRYTTVALLNIATRGDDDDGQRTKTKGIPDPPEGYDNWLADLESVAEEGTMRLKAAWKDSKAAYRIYLTSYAEPRWDALKAKAAKVSS